MTKSQQPSALVYLFPTFVFLAACGQREPLPFSQNTSSTTQARSAASVVNTNIPQRLLYELGDPSIWTEKDRLQLRQYNESGMNIMIVSLWTAQSVIEEIKSNRFGSYKIIVSLWYDLKTHYSSTCGYDANCSVPESLLNQAIDLATANPSIVAGYYLMDEPALHGVKKDFLERTHRYIRNRDPNDEARPTFIADTMAFYNKNDGKDWDYGKFFQYISYNTQDVLLIDQYDNSQEIQNRWFDWWKQSGTVKWFMPVLPGFNMTSCVGGWVDPVYQQMVSAIGSSQLWDRFKGWGYFVHASENQPDRYGITYAADNCAAIHNDVIDNLRKALSIPGIDMGYPIARGFFDIDGDRNLDFCRIVGNQGEMFASCASSKEGNFLAANQYLYNSDKSIDLGYPQCPRYFADRLSNRRPAYCRYVGNDPCANLSCLDIPVGSSAPTPTYACNILIEGGCQQNVPVGTWFADEWGHQNRNAHTDKNACFQRAHDYYGWCGKTNGKVTALFASTGEQTSTNYACSILIDGGCQQNVPVGTWFADEWGHQNRNAHMDKNACFQRAHDYYGWCGKTSGAVTAFFASTGEHTSVN